MAQIVDREQFRTVVAEEFGEVATTFAASEAQCVSPEESALIPEDAAAGAPLLSGVNIRLIGPIIVGTGGSGNEFVAEVLRGAGATVELQNVDPGTWVSTIYTQPDSWDMTVNVELNFRGSLANPLASFFGATPEEGGGNFAAVQSPVAQQAFAAALAATDEQEYCELLNDSANALIADAHGVPLMTDDFLYGTRPGFAAYMPGGSLDDHQFRIVG